MWPWGGARWLARVRPIHAVPLRQHGQCRAAKLAGIGDSGHGGLEGGGGGLGPNVFYETRGG